MKSYLMLVEFANHLKACTENISIVGSTRELVFDITKTVQIS